MTPDADAPGVTSFTESQLVRVARLFASDESLAAHLDDLPGDGQRRRVCLASTPHLEMWAISWPEDTVSEWHDHGRAEGAFVVVRGALLEEEWSENGIRETVVNEGEHHNFRTGIVHRTRPAGNAPALTVHAYAPSLVGARTYDIIEGRLVELVA